MTLLDAPKLKVGVFAVAIAVVTAYMSVKVGDNPKLLAGGQRAHFVMEDAGGLVKGSQVKMSGIPVGLIRDIRLENGIARIDITVSSDSPLTVSAIARIKSQGILGDKYVDIYPGSPTDPPLGSGDRIERVEDTGSLDKVVGQIGQISDSVRVLATNLADAVTEDGTNRHVLGRIVRNVERLTQDLADITTTNKGQINEIVSNLNSVTKSLDDIISDESEEGLKSRIQVAMNRLDKSLKNIEEITQKVNDGEGTLGKLISDEATAEKVENAIDGIQELLGGATGLQTSLDFQSQYLGQIGAAKTMVGVRLQPGPDRYYYLGIVDDPSGVVETTDIVTTGGGSPSSITEEKTYRNRIKFNVWFAKTLYNLTVRAGIIENSGGIGFDYSLARDKLKLSLEMLEFSQLNLRAGAQYTVWKGFYLTAGYQDILNKSQKQSGYLGVGLFLTNDDLKMLLTSLPTP